MLDLVEAEGQLRQQFQESDTALAEFTMWDVWVVVLRSSAGFHQRQGVRMERSLAERRLLPERASR